MLNIYLVRHGETAWNADGNRYCGRTDLPLTKKGITQAEALHAQLKNISLDAVYSSQLQRATQTAKIAAGSKEVMVDDRLIEIDFGNWEGKTKEEFIKEDPLLWENWQLDPEKTRAGGVGETASEVIDREKSFYDEILKKHSDGNILVVGHNGLNRLYLSWKLGMPLKNYRKFFLNNAAITWFTLSVNGEFVLKCLNGKI